MLVAAAQEMNSGLYEANLGSNVYKKRVSTIGRGKRSAFRTLLAFKKNDRLIFIFGSAKKQRSNIKSTELKAIKYLAGEYLTYSEKEMWVATENKELIEVFENG